MIDLSIIWAGIIAAGVLIYVILDGFGLGIGILFPLIKSTNHRNVMMNTIAPVWDGNETWMILGGASLYGAFPLVYSTLLSAFYLPIILMVIFLIFRGVAFEFRFKTHRRRYLWDWAFILGSMLTSFFQGIILGAYIQGIHMENKVYIGHIWDWLTPFSLFTGIGVMIMYATLGCAWLILKTQHDLQQSMYQLMPKLLIGLLIIFIGVSFYTPYIHPAIAKRWFSLPNLFYLLPIPLLVFICSALIIKACFQYKDRQPFFYSIGLVILTYFGFLISLWPNIIPPSITLWQAASAHSSQLFLLIGTIILLPIIIAYTLLSYWVFRHKVGVDDEEYH